MGEKCKYKNSNELNLFGWKGKKLFIYPKSNNILDEYGECVGKYAYKEGKVLVKVA